MKKVLIVVLVLLAIVLLLAIALVVYVGVSVYDKTDNTPSYLQNAEEKSVAILMNAYLQDSLEDTKTEKKVALLLNEEELNLILNEVANNLDIPTLKVKSLYCTYLSDGSKSFEMPCSVMGFSSCVKGSIKIVETEGKFDITINSISLGKLDTSSGLLKTALSSVNYKKTEEKLKEENIDLSLDYKDGKIEASITKEAILKISDKLEDEEGTAYLYSAAVDMLLGNDDFIDFRLDGVDEMGVVIFLQNMLYTKTYNFDLESGAQNLSTIVDKTKTLITNEVVNVENLSLVFDYLVRGYDALTEEKQEKINLIDFTSIGISKNKNYAGIVSRSDTTMAKIFAESAASGALNMYTIILGGYYDVNISEDALNEILHSLNFTGTSFAFVDGDEIAYVTIDGIHVEIDANTMTLEFILDVNGLLVSVDLHTSSEGSTAAAITLTVDSIVLAGEDISNEAKVNLLHYLNIILAEEEYLSFNPEEKTLTFDFSSFISSNSFFQQIIASNLSNISIVLKDTEEIAIRFHN